MRLIAGPAPSPGDVVPREEDASGWVCIEIVSNEPEDWELGYELGADMNGIGVNGVGGGDGRFPGDCSYDW
jgi:hypothetical protein